MHIIQCDEKVQSDVQITSGQQLKDYMEHFTVKGGGGTDFRPAFTYVDQLLNQKKFTRLRGLIYFTDGYGTYPTMPTPYKTAFAFLEDYDHKSVPPWAMSVYWKDDEFVTSED